MIKTMSDVKEQAKPVVNGSLIDDKSQQATTIVAGKPVKVEAGTRAEASERGADLRKQAANAGLVESAGGFIEYCKKDYLDKGKFCTTVTFDKP